MIQHQLILLLDVPGYGAIAKDHEPLQLLASWLNGSEAPSKNLTALLFLRPVNVCRMDATDLEFISSLRHLAAHTSTASIHMGAIGWDTLDEIASNRFGEWKTTPQYWGNMLETGSKIWAIREDRHAHFVIHHLATKSRSSDITLEAFMDTEPVDSVQVLEDHRMKLAEERNNQHAKGEESTRKLIAAEEATMTEKMKSLELKLEENKAKQKAVEKDLKDRLTLRATEHETVTRKNFLFEYRTEVLRCETEELRQAPWQIDGKRNTSLIARIRYRSHIRVADIIFRASRTRTSSLKLRNEASEERFASCTSCWGYIGSAYYLRKSSASENSVIIVLQRLRVYIQVALMTIVANTAGFPEDTRSANLAWTAESGV